MKKIFRNKPGPKPKPPGEKKERSRPLYILVDSPERESIDKAAELFGLPASTWARQVLLRAANRTKIAKTRR